MPDIRRKVIVQSAEAYEKELRKPRLVALPAIVPAPVQREPAEGVTRRARRIFEQRRKWPNACTQCGGDGGFGNDADDDDEMDIETEVCSRCLGDGKCPRCAANLPGNWRMLLEGLARAVVEGTRPPAPVKCGSCRWEDGDPPVLTVD